MFSEVRRSGKAGVALVGVLSFCSALPGMAVYSPCDLNQDGLVNSADVTLAVNMALGTTTCTASVEGANVCTVITVQRVVNAANGEACITYNTHQVSLSWTASTSTGVTGYDIYRSTTTGGPYTQIGTIAASPYVDASVQAGQTYYYVITAVGTSGQSGYSSQVTATIPTP